MRRLCLFSFLLLSGIMYAQRYTGYGRGSDYDIMHNSGLGPGTKLLIILFAVVALLSIYLVSTHKWGRPRWTVSEFQHKKGEIKCHKPLDTIEELLFVRNNKVVIVTMGEGCREFTSIAQIMEAKNVSIVCEEGKYILRKSSI